MRKAKSLVYAAVARDSEGRVTTLAETKESMDILKRNYGRQLSKQDLDKHNINYLRKKNVENCKYCGGGHKIDRQACPAFAKQCHGCGKITYFKRMCHSEKF